MSSLSTGYRVKLSAQPHRFQPSDIRHLVMHTAAEFRERLHRRVILCGLASGKKAALR